MDASVKTDAKVQASGTNEPWLVDKVFSNGALDLKKKTDSTEHAPGQWVRDQLFAARPDVRVALQTVVRDANGKELGKGIPLDFNRDGTVEPGEVFKDFDGDGVVGNVKDFVEYYKRNRATFNTIPFFKAAWNMDPHNMRSTLPVHDMLSLILRDGSATIEDVKRVYTELKGMIDDARLKFAIPHPRTIDVNASRDLTSFKSAALRTYLLKRTNLKEMKLLSSRVRHYDTNVPRRDLDLFDTALLATSASRQLGVPATIHRQGPHFILRAENGRAARATNYFKKYVGIDEMRIRELTPTRMLSAIYERLARSAFHIQGRASDALGYSEIARNLDSKNAANILLGALIYEDWDIYVAINRAMMAIAADPGYEHAYRMVGDLHNDRGAGDEALQYLRKAQALKPNSKLVYSSMGKAYFEEKKYDKAIDYFMRAVDMDPTFDYPYRMAAYAYARKNDHARAVTYAHKAIKADPPDVRNYDALARILYRADKNAEAVKVYEQVLRMAPWMKSAIFNMGLCYEDMGKYKEAIALYKRHIATDGIDLKKALEHAQTFEAKAYFKKTDVRKAFGAIGRISSCYYKMGNRDEAVKYAMITEAALKDDDWLNVNGRAALWVGAVATYGKDPKNPSYDTVTMPTLYFAADAKKFYEKNRTIDTIYANALYHYRLSREAPPNKDEIEDAVQAFEQALRHYHKPKDRAFLLMRLGLSQSFYKDKEHLKDAVVTLNRALRLNPRLAESYVGMARAYKHMKIHDRAIHYYRLALKRLPRTLRRLRIETRTTFANYLFELKRYAEADQQLKLLAAE